MSCMDASNRFVSFFLSTSKGVCYRMIDWKKGLESDLNYWMKRSWKALNFLGFLVQKPWCKQRCWLMIVWLFMMVMMVDDDDEKAGGVVVDCIVWIPGWTTVEYPSWSWAPPCRGSTTVSTVASRPKSSTRQSSSLWESSASRSRCVTGSHNPTSDKSELVSDANVTAAVILYKSYQWMGPLNNVHCLLDAI